MYRHVREKNLCILSTRCICVHMILVGTDYFYLQALTNPIFLMEVTC